MVERQLSKECLKILTNATVSFVVLGILSIVVTEILRSVVDRKRLERDGLGGTQDIAIYGMIVGWLSQRNSSRFQRLRSSNNP